MINKRYQHPDWFLFSMRLTLWTIRLAPWILVAGLVWLNSGQA